MKDGKNFSELETFAATVMEDNLELATNTLKNKNLNQDNTSTSVYNFNRVTENWITEVHVDTETWTDIYVPNQVKYTYTIDGIKYEQILDITSWYYGSEHLPE